MAPSSLDGSSLLCDSPVKGRGLQKGSRDCANLMQQVERLKQEYQQLRSYAAPTASSRARQNPMSSDGYDKGAALYSAPRQRRPRTSCLESHRRPQTPPRQAQRTSIQRRHPPLPRGRISYTETLRGLSRRVDLLEDEQARTKRWREEMEKRLEEKENTQRQLAARVLALTREAQEYCAMQATLKGPASSPPVPAPYPPGPHPSRGRITTPLAVPAP